MRLVTLDFASDLVRVHGYKRVMLWDTGRTQLLGHYELAPEALISKLQEMVPQMQGLIRAEFDTPRRENRNGVEVEARGQRKADAVVCVHLQGTLGGVSGPSSDMDARFARLEALLLKEDAEDDDEPSGNNAFAKALEQLVPLLVQRFGGSASAPITGPSQPAPAPSQPAMRSDPPSTGNKDEARRVARAIHNLSQRNPQLYADMMTQLLNTYGDADPAN